jgi:AhpD family alkylhydroperoxidase
MIRYLTPVSTREASGRVAQIYRQIEKEFLLGEPLTLHSPVPDLLAGVWSAFRETFVAGRVARALKEAVAVSISRGNRCPFCVDAHSMALRSTSSSAGIEKLRTGDADRIEDAELRAVAQWAEKTVRLGTEPVPGPPVPSGDVAEIMGALTWMHYSNRMVNLFIGDGLIPVSSNRFGLRSLLERAGGWYFRRTFNRVGAPGESLVFLKGVRSETPKDLGWAAGSPFIALAFGGFAGAVEQGAGEAVPAVVRSWFLECWSGAEEPITEPSRRWLEVALAGLEPRFHAIGRLLLLTSRSPYQVTVGDIEAFRKDRPAERDLLQATAWAALTTARRIAERVSGAPRPSRAGETGRSDGSE